MKDEMELKWRKGEIGRRKYNIGAGAMGEGEKREGRMEL